jgi:hydroxymethylpyrimidine/phosphomethylpyrimidine kinase
MDSATPEDPRDRCHPPGGDRAGRTPVALTIAGSDSSGGAGMQADLKAFARCGVHGACALTAVTAQSTSGVHALHPLPAPLVRAQIAAVLTDMRVDAVKLGMLPNAEVAIAVADALDPLPAWTPVVVDPVLRASTGAQLADPGARQVLIERLVPRATVLTPNVPEARALADATEPHAEDASATELVRELLRLGPRAVVLTGGHREDLDERHVVDLFAHRAPETADGGAASDGGAAPESVEIVEIAGQRAPGDADHGSGCTHSALIAAQLALGCPPLAAARRARALAGEAIARGLRDLGEGPGPVDVIGLERMRREHAGR